MEVVDTQLVVVGNLLEEEGIPLVVEPGTLEGSPEEVVAGSPEVVARIPQVALGNHFEEGSHVEQGHIRHRNLEGVTEEVVAHRISPHGTTREKSDEMSDGHCSHLCHFRRRAKQRCSRRASMRSRMRP